MNNADEFIPTRKSLLSRLRNLDDQESWRLFFETYWKLIYRAAVRAGLNPSEAEDVVQDTVIRITKSIQKFKYDPAKGSFKAYLMKLTHWCITRQFGKRLPVKAPPPRHCASSTAENIDCLALPPELELLWDREWEQNLMEAAIQKTKAKVDPKLYQAFDLYVHQNWPVSKIAEDLRITCARVYVAKHKVGKLIRREVARLRAQPL